MSQDNDKVKSDDDSMIYDQIQVNEANTKTTNKILNNQNTRSGFVNNGKTHETIPKIRENMVSKATDFLIYKSMKSAPSGKISDFLRKKGLTEKEVQLSIQRASAILEASGNPNSKTSVDHTNSSNNFGAVQTSFETQNWFKRLFGPIAFTALIVYIGYQTYIRYLKEWLFGSSDRKRKSQTEKSLEALESSMRKCVLLLESKNKTDEFIADHHKDLNQIRTEIKSLRSLLLNRSQFPPAPTSSSLPEWQTKKKVKSSRPDNDSDIGTIRAPTSSSLPEWQTEKKVKSSRPDDDNDVDIGTIRARLKEKEDEFLASTMVNTGYYGYVREYPPNIYNEDGTIKDMMGIDGNVKITRDSHVYDEDGHRIDMDIDNGSENNHSNEDITQ